MSQLHRLAAFAPALLVLQLATGCAPPAASGKTVNLLTVSEKARAGLKSAIQYPHNPVVRIQAIEAYQRLGSTEALPWIRIAVHDDEPAVRFAACIALGDMKDTASESSVRPLLHDPDEGVRIGAIYALHRMGNAGHTGQLTYYLFDHRDPVVRRQAAFTLGRIENADVVRMLARAMKDKDVSVQFNALEGMARHGIKQAIDQLQVMANSGVGAEEVGAVGALADLQNPKLNDFFRYKLYNAQHLETKLAAARGLALNGNLNGFELAMNSLNFDEPRLDEPNDPPADQVLRVRQLAMLALGASGRVEALDPLERDMLTSDDPRLQATAAKAILDIVRREQERSKPFGRS